MYSTGSTGPTFIVLAVAMTIASCLIAFSVAVPEWRPALFEEDRVVEWGTVLCFAAAFGFGLRRLLSAHGNDLLLLSASLASGLAVLDELSFGERFIGYDAPRVLGVKLDAVHDLLPLTKNFLQKATPYPYAVAGFIAVAIVALSIPALRALLRRGWVFRPDGSRVLLFVSAVTLVIGAQAIDVNMSFLPHEDLKRLYVEEILELAAGILVLGVCLLRPPQASRRVST